MNPEQWLSLKWNGGSTMSDRWLNQSKIIQEDAEKHLLKKKMMLELRNINYSEKTNSLNQLLLMKLAYEVGKLDFTDDTMLKIPLPVNYKEMSEETLKSFLESDGEYE